MPRPFIKHLLTVAVSFSLVACATDPINPIQVDVNSPSKWQSPHTGNAVNAHWLNDFADAELSAMAAQAMQTNRTLAQARYQLEQARQQAVIAGADQLPGVTLNGRASRSDSGSAILSNYDLDLRLSWQLDIWGQLDDQAREAALNLAAQQASLADSELTLISDLASNWYRLQEAQMLLALYQQRRANLQENLELIQSRYQQGLSSALDIYLARNNVRSEDARVSAQQQTVLENRRQLEQLLASYPAGLIAAPVELPMIDQPLPAGLPAELIQRRPDIQASWLQLLASDAALAAAQKDRFPALTLTSNLGRSSSELSDLLSGGSLAWSLAASLAQTLFDGGRKEATQALRQAQRAQLEQQYLATVYTAFEQVENLLSNQQALQQQYGFYIEARTNADAAELLAFEQYQKGLATYTTVLEAQRRAFDARSSVISLRSQLLLNRIALHRALGGDFKTVESNTGTDA